MNAELQGYRVNNKDNLADIVFTPYDIDDLDNYFLTANISRYDEENTYLITIDQSNEYFPIECLRSNGDAFYSVYKVSQGGYYYVFWIKATDTDTNTEYVIAHYVIYIADMVDYDRFTSLSAGTSTAKDVKMIDRYFEFVGFVSHATLSYSLTSQGLLEISYEISGEASSLDSYIISSMNIVNKKIAASCIAGILEKDLKAYE